MRDSRQLPHPFAGRGDLSYKLFTSMRTASRIITVRVLLKHMGILEEGQVAKRVLAPIKISLSTLNEST